MKDCVHPVLICTQKIIPGLWCKIAAWDLFLFLVPFMPLQFVSFAVSIISFDISRALWSFIFFLQLFIALCHISNLSVHFISRLISMWT